MKNLLLLFLIAFSNYVLSQVVVQTSQPPPTQKVVLQKAAFNPGLRLNVYTMYAFDDKVDSRYSSTEYFNGTIKGGFQWGGGLEYLMMPQQGFELSYLRLDTKAPMTYSFDYAIPKKETFDVATNYVLIGSNRYFGMNPKIEPYGGIQVGMAIFNVKNEAGNSENDVKFAWGAKLGLNIWASDKIGLKMQTGLISAVQAAGGGLYFGTGGVGAGVNTYSTFFQFFVGGGLTYSFAK